MRLRVRVQTGASFNRVERLENGSIKAHLTARPFKDEANKALVKILAKELGVSKSRIGIIAGVKSKDKIVQIL